jgi:hypothetical protein
MQALTRFHDTRPHASLGALGLLAAAAVLLAACAARREPATAASGPRPKVLTVPEIKTMLEQGEQIPVIYGEIERSGTVYRLTTEQSKDLRASGMPASLLSMMEITYQHAIRQNPELARSNDRWTEIDGYWYGGLPYGWPREWVVGAPRPGEVLR